MTKDKAIENIKLLMEIDSYPKDFADALLMAIKALQGDMYCPNCGVRLVPENEYLEPTQTHGRLIDADALTLDAIRWRLCLGLDCSLCPFYRNGVCGVRRMINDAPTVQADRPHGEWVDEYGNKIPLHEDGYPMDSCYCNQCHEWLVASDEYGVMGKFCPNCGADMRKETE